MLAVLSPAKSLDFAPLEGRTTDPDFLADTGALHTVMRTFDGPGLQSLMGISEKLGALNEERYTTFEIPQPDMAKAAAYAFAGDVYDGLEAVSLAEDELAYAQDHLRILSGLYGLLRPLDRIQPHRLEMGTKLENPRGKNLYEFWGSKPTEALNAALVASESKILLNLASNEYFRAVKRKLVCATIIEPQFREHRDGKLKMISFFAKRARGTMARYMVQRRVSTEAELLAFAEDGYVYDAVGSTPGKPLFVRKSEAT